MKNLTWKIEWRDGAITITKDGASVATGTAHLYGTLTDLRDALNATVSR